MRLQEIAAVGSGRVDRASGRIRNVKILGAESRNNRRYSPRALSDVAKLANGIRVNVDHGKPGQVRGYASRIGRLVNVGTRDGAVFGDLIVNTGHPLAEQLFWDAENSPRAAGLSIDAEGELSGGVVTSVRKLRSVDLVTEPATVAGLFESTTPNERENAMSEYGGKKTWIERWVERAGSVSIVPPRKRKVAPMRLSESSGGTDSGEYGGRKTWTGRALPV